MSLGLEHRDCFDEVLRRNGLDICVPFRPEWYNQKLDEEGLDIIRLPTQDVAECYLIGNTRRFWSPFVEWCRSRYGNQNLPEHPVDLYCQECIEEATESRDCCIFWSAVFSRGGLVSMQRVAVVAGFAYHDRNTQLTIHPEYGAWTAFRAVVIFFGSGPLTSLSRPIAIPSLLSAEEEAKAKEAMEYALSLSDVNDLCQHLHKSLMTDEDKALAWIKIRDCVQLGKLKYRYEKNQLMYHYTKDKKFLRDAMCNGHPTMISL